MHDLTDDFTLVLVSWVYFNGKCKKVIRHKLSSHHQSAVKLKSVGTHGMLMLRYNQDCVFFFSPGWGVLLEILGGGVPPGSSNPDPISDQKM